MNMAKNQITPQALAELRLTENEHPCWSGAFTETTRCHQIEDDLFAARTVSALLMAIVTAGALLGGFAVLMAWIF